MDEQELYMALLTVYENNFRGLHWKLSGHNFNNNHTRFGDYYEQLGTYLDETAEQMIIQGKTPISSSRALDILNQDNISAILIDMSLDYTGDEANRAAAMMFEQLHGHALSLATSDSIPADTADVYMDHAKYYSIEGKYKLARALQIKAEQSPATPAPGVTEEPMNEE